MCVQQCYVTYHIANIIIAMVDHQILSIANEYNYVAKEYEYVITPFNKIAACYSIITSLG